MKGERVNRRGSADNYAGRNPLIPTGNDRPPGQRKLRSLERTLFLFSYRNSATLNRLLTEYNFPRPWAVARREDEQRKGNTLAIILLSWGSQKLGNEINGTRERWMYSRRRAILERGVGSEACRSVQKRAKTISKESPAMLISVIPALQPSRYYDPKAAAAATGICPTDIPRAGRSSASGRTGRSLGRAEFARYRHHRFNYSSFRFVSLASFLSWGSTIRDNLLTSHSCGAAFKKKCCRFVRHRICAVNCEIELNYKEMTLVFFLKNQ